jgi:hypothetical protein
MEEVVLYHKGHKIRIVEAGARDLDGDNNVINKYQWFNSYVDGIKDSEQYKCSCGDGFEVTYSKDNEVGFDTAHMYCEDMSMAGKFYDALRQALCFINELKKEHN